MKRITTLAAIALLLLISALPVQAGPTIATAPNLGVAGSFAVLAYSTVTNVGASIVSGNLGVSPGTAVTGFPPGVVINGTIHSADALAAQAQADATAAYLQLAGQACDVTYPLVADIGGTTILPGVYCFPSSAGITGQLILDGQGDPNSVWVFNIESTLVTAPASSVLLINGANPCNVFWRVGSSATLDTTTRMQGHIFALASISVNTGATQQGGLYALNGAVTLQFNLVTNPCGQQPTPTPTATAIPPTSTNTATDTPVNTPVDTATSTSTPVNTAVNTPTSTRTPQNTSTRTSTPVNTSVSTSTRTSTPTRTRINTATSTATSTKTRTPTKTPTAPHATKTKTKTPTRTRTPAYVTKTRTPTHAPYSTKTKTPTKTRTPYGAPTRTPTPNCISPNGTRWDCPTETPVVPCATVYSSQDVPVFICDECTVMSSLTVPGGGTIAAVEVVNLRVSQTYPADLDVYLISPSGTRVELFTDKCGGQDWTNSNTGFGLAQGASQGIGNSCPPGTLTYRPEGNLNALQGQGAAGVWKLELTDDGEIDVGTLFAWGLRVVRTCQ